MSQEKLSQINKTVKKNKCYYCKEFKKSEYNLYCGYCRRNGNTSAHVEGSCGFFERR